MKRFDLMVSNGTIWEYRPMNWWRRRAYRRRIRRQMRYVDPPFETLFVLLEATFWIVLAGLCVAGIASIPVLFVRWWLCI